MEPRGQEIHCIGRGASPGFGDWGRGGIRGRFATGWPKRWLIGKAMADLARIGVVNMAVDWWTAGESYTRMLVESLAAAKEGRPTELLLLSRKKSGQKEEP